MRKRPISVTIVSWLYIVAGVAGIAYHSTELNLRHPFEADIILPLIVRLLAIVAGVFMLRGQNWARWLAVAWIGYHVVFAGLHSLGAGAMHAVLLAVFAFFLFRSVANAYFAPPATLPVVSGTSSQV